MVADTVVIRAMSLILRAITGITLVILNRVMVIIRVIITQDTPPNLDTVDLMVPILITITIIKTIITTEVSPGLTHIPTTATDGAITTTIGTTITTIMMITIATVTVTGKGAAITNNRHPANPGLGNVILKITAAMLIMAGQTDVPIKVNQIQAGVGNNANIIKNAVDKMITAATKMRAA